VTKDAADVVVVGAGAAGAALTWRLAQRGARVVCLEQGDWAQPEDFASARTDFEVSLRRGPHSLLPSQRRRPEDYPLVGVGIEPDQIAMHNGVGGGTVHWEAHFPRFHPSDFRVRGLDAVADDWPIGYRDLEPYYDLNDRMMGVSGLAGDPANAPRSPRPLPPLPIGRSAEALVRGFEKLGWHWWVSDNAVASRDHDGRSGCDDRGRCNLGCALRAKASCDVTYWPKALALGAELRTWTRVRQVVHDAGGRATGVLYYDRAGQLHEQRASAVVVCCNGIGTPRLLLNSKSPLFPDGIGNGEGMVGRHFMIHPARYLEASFAEPFETASFSGSPIFSQEFYETDRSRDFVRGYSLMIYRPFGPLSVAWGDVEPVPWGAAHHEEMRRRFGHTVGIAVMAEDLPEPENRVELDGERADSHGIPAPRVTYRVGDNTRRMLAHGAASARQALQAAGALAVRDNGRIGYFAHLMGTARMGSDPGRSVVDRWHRVHAVPHLYVVDGSSFVTSAAVNPTSTIGALALRAADGIWNERGRF
jgi:choline dehydrogenase-like flavoprotein